MVKHVGFSERDLLETNHTYNYGGNDDEDNDYLATGDNSDDGSTQAFHNLKGDSFHDSADEDREAMAAERLSMRLLSVPDDDEEEADRVLRESLHFVMASEDEIEIIKRKSIRAEKQATGSFTTMIILFMLGGILLVILVAWLAPKVIGPPRQPLGPYYLVERQVNKLVVSGLWLLLGVLVLLSFYCFNASLSFVRWNAVSDSQK